MSHPCYSPEKVAYLQGRRARAPAREGREEGRAGKGEKGRGARERPRREGGGARWWLATRRKEEFFLQYEVGPRQVREVGNARLGEKNNSFCDFLVLS
jgi:hypothetical protein